MFTQSEWFDDSKIGMWTLPCHTIQIRSSQRTWTPRYSYGSDLICRRMKVFIACWSSSAAEAKGSELIGCCLGCCLCWFVYVFPAWCGCCWPYIFWFVYVFLAWCGCCWPYIFWFVYVLLACCGCCWPYIFWFVYVLLACCGCCWPYVFWFVHWGLCVYVFTASWSCSRFLNDTPGKASASGCVGSGVRRDSDPPQMRGNVTHMETLSKCLCWIMCARSLRLLDHPALSGCFIA